jgi:hypothetical protein
MTYYLDVEPAGIEPDRIIRRYEMPVEAESVREAVMSARQDPNVLMITGVRDWPKPKSRLRFPEDAGPRLACLHGMQA